MKKYNYHPILDIWETEQAIKFIKDTFQNALSSELHLRRITAPLFVKSGQGLNDNLSGKEQPVTFSGKSMHGDTLEIVQSLAKWKRFALWQHHISPGLGIYTDMNALRPDEELDNIHSLYVDQWDWEKVINREERTEQSLQQCVKSIYSALKCTEFLLSEHFQKLAVCLPEEIFFIHSEDLLQMYPTLCPKERENAIAKKHKAVFIQGIGGKLSDGSIHDMRSPDYDDWSTEIGEGKTGLNGDIILYNDVLDMAFEISSMGIRVDSESLIRQLKISGAKDRDKLLFHKTLLEGKLPQTMGGGIGQSRLCMFLLKKAHIGEVQSSVWPDKMIEECKKEGIVLF